MFNRYFYYEKNLGRFYEFVKRADEPYAPPPGELVLVLTTIPGTVTIYKFHYPDQRAFQICEEFLIPKPSPRKMVIQANVPGVHYVAKT